MNEMTQTKTPDSEPAIVNGVDVDYVAEVIGMVQDDPEVGAFRFRADNAWQDGALNRTRIAGFFGAHAEHTHTGGPFTPSNDEPPVLAGAGTAPNPVEWVLHGLAGCLTTTLVYHAAARGIGIEACSSSLEGDIDLRGFLGLSDTVRKGFHQVRVTLRVKSDADTDTLRELALFSPVYDIVSNSLPVELTVEKV